MLTELEKKIIAAIQGDMPIVEKPFAHIGAEIGIEEDTLLGVLEDLVHRGVIRRFGATLRHQKSGFHANAMTAWRVDEARIEEVGDIMASFKEVSHCYRRNPTPEWKYNLYTMIHGKSQESVLSALNKITIEAGLTDHAKEVLFSGRRFRQRGAHYASIK